MTRRRGDTKDLPVNSRAKIVMVGAELARKGTGVASLLLQSVEGVTEAPDRTALQRGLQGREPSAERRLELRQSRRVPLLALFGSLDAPQKVSHQAVRRCQHPARVHRFLLPREDAVAARFERIQPPERNLAERDEARAC